MPASIFDRLAHQGTAASKAREAEERESRERHRQRKAADAAAAASKPRHVRLPQDQPSSDGPVKSPRKSPQEQAAFFDRLARQETASSAAHHHHVPDDGDGGPKSPAANRKKVARDGQQGAVFNRLYKQETAASKAHHTKAVDAQAPKPEQKKKKSKPAPPPSLLKRLEEKKAAEGSGCGGSGSGGPPPVPIQMALRIRTAAEKKDGGSYSELSITQSDVRRQVNLFHSGKVSAHALACDVITALFDRDFAPGAHWEVGTAIVGELDPLADKTLLTGDEEAAEGEFECFDAEKEAVWDWKDVYSVAKARATIKICKESVLVDDYSYYVAG